MGSENTDRHLLPAKLPMPVDDGACDHLKTMKMPSVILRPTSGRLVNVADISQAPSVFFFYPRTGKPGTPVPSGWDDIPGARGCTPQSCSFRDHYGEFKRLGFEVFGVSAQPFDEQLEFAGRENNPYELLNDSDFQLTNALRLPKFEFQVRVHVKRLCFVVNHGEIERVFYPVFPPNKNAEDVLAYLRKTRTEPASVLRAYST